MSNDKTITISELFDSNDRSVIEIGKDSYLSFEDQFETSNSPDENLTTEEMDARLEFIAPIILDKKFP